MRSWQSADFVVGIFTVQDHMTAFAPPEIDREVGRDSIEPRRKTGSGFEFGKVFERSYEGLLCEFNRVILIVHYRECYADYAALIPLHQDAERLGITLAGPFD